MVLTSYDDNDLAEGRLHRQRFRSGGEAERDVGVDGIVCSAEEAAPAATYRRIACRSCSIAGHSSGWRGRRRPEARADTGAGDCGGRRAISWSGGRSLKRRIPKAAAGASVRRLSAEVAAAAIGGPSNAQKGLSGSRRPSVKRSGALRQIPCAAMSGRVHGEYRRHASWCVAERPRRRSGRAPVDSRVVVIEFPEPGRRRLLSFAGISGRQHGAAGPYDANKAVDGYDGAAVGPIVRGLGHDAASDPVQRIELSETHSPTCGSGGFSSPLPPRYTGVL